MSYCIYAIVDPRSDLIFYVGHTRDLGRRRAEHLEGTDTLSGLQVRQIKENGFVPLIIKLEDCKDQSAALMSEVFWIELLKARGIKLSNAQAFAGYGERGRERGRRARELRSMKEARLKAIANGKPARDTRAWSARDEARLKGMSRSGMDVASMADALERSMGTVRKKLKTLRIDVRD